MTRKISVGIIQQANSADIEYNRKRLAAKIIDLAQRGAQLVVLQDEILFLVVIFRILLSYIHNLSHRP